MLATLVFFCLGVRKLTMGIFLGTDAVSLPSGPAGFAMYLAAVDVPFPLLSAYIVCLTEIICGLGLLVSAFLPARAILTRLSAFPLMVDMMVASLTVGIPTVLGHPVMLNGIPVTNQIWRPPLEMTLLLISLFMLWRPEPKRARAQAAASP